MSSKREMALWKIAFSDPSYSPIVLPVAGNGGFSVVMAGRDKCTGRIQYGQILATYQYRRLAEQLCEELRRVKKMGRHGL